MTLGGQRVESSLESGSRSDREASGSTSSSPEVSSRSDTQSDRGESPLVKLADRVRSDGASLRSETTDLQIVPFEEDPRDGEATEHAEEEVDERGEEEDEQGEEVRTRRRGSKRKGAITRITNGRLDVIASWRRENLLRERAIALAPIQVNAPSLAARLKAKRSEKKDQQASASRSEHSDRIQIVQKDAEVVPQHDANLEGEIETQVADHNLGLDAQNQEESHQEEEASDEAARSARKAEKKQRKKKDKKRKEKKDEAEAVRLVQQKEKEEVAKSKASGKRKEPSAREERDGGRVSGEDATKRARVAPSGDDRVKEVDRSFSFEYPESSRPFVNNADKCAELFGKIRGSTTEVPAVSDVAFKEMASFAFKFIASCNRTRGQYICMLQNAATRLKNAQTAGQRAVDECRHCSAEDCRRQLANHEEKSGAAGCRGEGVDREDRDDEIEAERSIATEVVRAKRHAEEKIEMETTRIWAEAEAKYSGRIGRLRTRISEQEAIEQVKLDLVQARGTLECLDLLKEQEMSDAELKAELEATKRDYELKLENLSLTDLEEGDLLPPFPETPDGGSDHDDAEDREDHEDGTQPEE
ncbi:uncharacterized protein LOC112083443 [Eutrema salsugineum]|uniref:uncharacterized protein LOC112083443 n=1 Tax=Eutrema salsugineum TaxID=72664 RepID=UPI000CED42FA|nr:uncharacterized protein LOC112083443 [Eutrema salsugineum]